MARRRCRPGPRRLGAGDRDRARSPPEGADADRDRLAATPHRCPAIRIPGRAGSRVRAGAASARFAGAGRPRPRAGAQGRPAGRARRSPGRARGRGRPRAAAGGPQPPAAPGHSIGSIRAFVAILLDDAVRGKLGAGIDDLRLTARDVSWVTAGNLHLTVKFLGEVDEGRIEAIAAALIGAVAGEGAFEAQVEGLGAFPATARPRVVWAGVTAGAPAIGDLAERVDAALAALRG